MGLYSAAALNYTSIYDQIAFAGVTGRVLLDDKADRVGDYAVWHMDAGNDTYYRPLLFVIKTDPINETVKAVIHAIL
jgi:hypothetical protein